MRWMKLNMLLVIQILIGALNVQQMGILQPFKLNYVEIGNEDWFDRSNSYDGRFNQFRAAIEAKYPQLKCISTIAGAQYPSMKVNRQRA